MFIRTSASSFASSIASTIALLSISLLLVSTAVQAQMSAGFRQQTLQTSASEKISAAIWYPSQSQEVTVPIGPSLLTVAMNAAPISGQYPLIVISHGTGGMNLNQHEIAAALARAGNIVLAINHPGDNYQDRSLVGNIAYFSERPRQISRSLDVLLKDNFWKPLIDENRIGLIGHSAGGFAGLALLGATPSLANTVQHCADNFDDDLWFCKVSGSKQKAQSDAKNIAYMPALPSSTDVRIKSAVIIAPVGAFFSPQALANVKAPIKLYIAPLDEILTPRFHAEYIARNVKSAEPISIAKGGHFMLLSKLILPAGGNITINGSEVNFDPPGFSRQKAIDEAQADIAAWFSLQFSNKTR